MVLHGSGTETIPFEYPDMSGRKVKRVHRFEGVIPNLERRYKDTESLAVKEELSRYLSDKPVPGMPRRAPKPDRAARLRGRPAAAGTVLSVGQGTPRPFSAPCIYPGQ